MSEFDVRFGYTIPGPHSADSSFIIIKCCIPLPLWSSVSGPHWTQSPWECPRSPLKSRGDLLRRAPSADLGRVCLLAGTAKQQEHLCMPKSHQKNECGSEVSLITAFPLISGLQINDLWPLETKHYLKNSMCIETCFWQSTCFEGTKNIISVCGQVQLHMICLQCLYKVPSGAEVKFANF